MGHHLSAKPHARFVLLPVRCRRRLEPEDPGLGGARGRIRRSRERVDSAHSAPCGRPRSLGLGAALGQRQRHERLDDARDVAEARRRSVVQSASCFDDNPFIEALFRTLKYCPEYPSGGFASLDAASAWVGRFVDWYNNEHQHSGIGYVAPSARHSGDDFKILAKRRAVYTRARRAHPTRWARHTRPWSAPLTVTLNPAVAA